MSFSLAQRPRTQSPSRQPPPMRNPGAMPSNQARLQQLRRQLRIGAGNTPMEHQADHAANQVMRMPEAAPAPLQLSRKCPACESEDGKLQTKRAEPAGAGAQAPAAVHQVLSTPGRPLDAGLRGFFEPRFGADLSQIRIHDGPAAARSAAAVDARAYTVGQDLVFGAAQYRPGDPAGMQLMAHELAHSVQQGAASQTLSRACLSTAECTAPEAKKGSLDEYVKEQQAKNKARDDARAAVCNKTPPDPACTADGHGRVATELTKFMTAQLPARMSAIYRLIVNMDMPYAGNTIACDGFKPEIPGGAGKQCTFVPNKLELEAERYNAGDDTVGGMDRLHWSQRAQRLLTHETEHAMFTAAEKSGTEVKDPAIACDFAANRTSLTELAAEISEFKPVHKKALALTGDARDANLAWWFNFWIKTGGENITGNVKSIRCNCDCGPADAVITKMFNFASKDWNTYEKWIYNKTLQDPKWGLNWPVAPPASVPINEIPNSGPTVDAADLPSAAPPAKSPAKPPVKP
jgi:hypothetical protein